MKNLSPPDLLRCSVVCKLWYSVAYPLIQKRFCRFLTLDHHDDCANLMKLTEILKQSPQNLPYTGLSVIYERPHPPRNPFWVLSHEDRLDSAWDNFCQILQTKLALLDYVRVNIGSSPSPATVRGAQQVLKTCSPSLKRLSVTSDWFNRSPVVSQKMDTIRGLWVAPCENDDEDSWRRENLDKLHRFVQIRPQLEKLWFSSLRQMNGSVRHHLPLDYIRSIRHILKELLERPSLFELSVDIFDIVWLLQENQFPVIPQLTHLTLIVDNFLVTEEGRDVLTLINFDYYFPNVRHIKFWFASGRYEDAPTLLRRVDQVPVTKFISSRVNTLSFFGEGDTCSVRPIFLQECAKGFKEVKHLWFHTPQKDSLLWGIFFRTIFESWSDLDTLTLANTPGSALRENLDHVFCGIGLDELKLLRMSSVESLENLQFVPYKPSIAHMKSKVFYLLQL